jgi:hypothetical protein
MIYIRHQDEPAGKTERFGEILYDRLALQIGSVSEGKFPDVEKIQEEIEKRENHHNGKQFADVFEPPRDQHHERSEIHKDPIIGIEDLILYEVVIKLKAPQQDKKRPDKVQLEKDPQIDTFKFPADKINHGW